MLPTASMKFPKESPRLLNATAKPRPFPWCGTSPPRESPGTLSSLIEADPPVSKQTASVKLTLTGRLSQAQPLEIPSSSAFCC